MKSLLILGRQPALGLAELESLYGAAALTPIRPGAALLDVPAHTVPFDRLGGSLKLTKVLTTLPSTDWRKIEGHLGDLLPALLSEVPEGKFRLGLSVYGLHIRPNDINATALRLKKIVKAADRSVRIVPNKATALNSAQVLHNQLTSPTGCELVIVAHGAGCIVAQTVAEQDIEAYARRDQERPMRDAKVGMLPPKLAQIIINMSLPPQEGVVLDPFCGTGVLLQEAYLMGLDAIGTDIEPRMIDYSKKNIDWLFKSYRARQNKVDMHQGDATSFDWKQSFLFTPDLSVACETFLGKPLSSLPPRHVLDAIRGECDDIHERFLTNLAQQLTPGARLCLAVPAWRLKTGFLHLKTLDHLEKMGYTRMSFVHVRTEELVYHRPDQTVARELVVLVKK